jgi:signal transduction histidine kinase
MIAFALFDWWCCRAAKTSLVLASRVRLREVRRRQLPSAGARRVLAICGVYLISVGLLIVSGRVGGPSRSSGLIQFLVVVTGLVAIGMLTRMFLERSTGEPRDLAVSLVNDREVPSQSEFAVGADDARTGNRTELKGADYHMSQLERALKVGVVVTDDGGRPQVVGDRARDLLGLEGSTPIDDGAFEAFDELRKTAARAAKTGTTNVASVSFSSSRGREHLEATAIPTNGGENVVVQLRNLDHVRSLRRNLLDAARQRGLTRLYLGVAHDLRAPINAIVLNLTNLKDSLIEDDGDSGREQLQTIEMVEDELLRLQRAVESLLGQTAPFATEPSTFDVRDVIEELEFLFRAQARQQRVDLAMVKSREPAMVNAPRDAIKQAVLNVVVNAFDAASEQARVEVDVIPAPPWVDIVVSDSGTGILDEIAPRLFEMHATTKESGSGIGLYVARASVQAAGGSLELVRTGPDGTVFKIRLPMAKGDLVGQET